MKYKLRKDPINEIPKAQLIFWIIVRISMLVCATYSFVTGDVVMGYVSNFRAHKFYYRSAAAQPNNA